jgi:hypothetical protein
MIKYVPPKQKITWREVADCRSHGLERAFMRCSRASWE